ncbi:copper amine oxidase N-terminal domain-containing protein [Paenibacillus albicereus]|uniref:Copper amine oxidase N-terminal domain-containing protein n=1 Tax=Paenibacillus albicereus TaxID=2726185 RepID=A0A6H2GTM5_9BACL|nr:copper amine oxidase N-terminal domain-containing protein [Paenibacillus albicereus]QJC50783.1 copper amine oxidase N-terminal domain-containing protein [Paenibacillus albicereus]
MKKPTKTIPALLSVAALSLAVSSVLAANPAEAIVPISAPLPDSNVQNEQQQPAPAYMSVTGKVKEISDSKTTEGAKTVSLQDDKGEIIANVTVSGDTYVASPDKLQAGTNWTVYYDANKPMIMIYPPQYTADVLVPVEENTSWKVDRFKGEGDAGQLLSKDGQLVLNVSKETPIVLEDGTAFTGDLKGRALAVKYGVTTRSLPPQTSPEQIVVLSEQPETPEEPSAYTPDVSGFPIVVEGKKLAGPSPYTSKDGTVMVPLRAVVEALGQKLTWEASTKTSRIGLATTLQVGKDYYVYNKMAPIELGAAPTLVDGKTYVPLHFFRDVMMLNNAYVFEGQIDINNQEKME